MTRVTMKLVTIIAEHVLRESITADLTRLGARGYSIGEVEGEGTRGVHAQDWQGKNLRIETIVTPEVATAILDQMAARYFTDYSVVVYATTIEVLRGQKFS